MSDLFLNIVNMSISASWLVLAVLLLRFVLKKAPKWVRVLLWGIVAVRLICPFSVESAWSLIPSAQTIPMNIAMKAAPAIDSGINAVNSVLNPIIAASFTPQPVTSINPLQIWIPVASVLWIAGIAALLFYAVISYRAVRRKVDTAVLYRDNIFQSEQVRSPFVLGVIKPRIYLPFKLDGQELDAVVAHEQTHIRRKDHWWKPLGFLLLSIHWFNPLMWLAYILLCRDIELACDEKVIQSLDNGQRADYTQALVDCSVSHPRITACPLAFGEVGVKERVKSIMNYKRPAFWVVILAVITCVAVAICFLTNPRQASFNIGITVPAGSQEAVVYADEEISPLGKYITLTAGDGLGDTQVYLKPVEVKTETAYDEPVNLTPGMPVKMEAEQGGWFQIGVSVQNDTDEDIVVYVNVKNVEVRIAGENTPEQWVLQAKILEIHDSDFLVEPVAGSWELNSADRIYVPMKNMRPSPEPQVGDIIAITYNGQIMETYPAQLGQVSDIRVVEQGEERNQFYLTIGAEGVSYIEISMPGFSGGCQHADGSDFQPGEQVWLDLLDGHSDLRGLRMRARNGAGEIVWEASVPDIEENVGVTNLTQDGWTITNSK